MMIVQKLNAEFTVVLFLRWGGGEGSGGWGYTVVNSASICPELKKTNVKLIYETYKYMQRLLRNIKAIQLCLHN